MIEALVLGVLQKVLGDYVSGLLLKKQDAKTRAELVETVRAELKTSSAANEQQVNALSIAVRELDAIVRRDPYLEWRDDELLETAHRQGVRRKKVSPAEVVEALEQSVRERRRELGLPSSPEAASTEPQPEAAPPTVAPPDPSEEFVFIPVEPNPDEPQAAVSDWGRRVLGLSADVAAERRRRAKKIDP
jgi:hypothetical protein